MPTDIEWTHFPGTIGETWNPINATRLDSGKRGCHCEKVSPGCANCYAETFNGRNLPACGTGLDYTVPNRELVQIGIHEDTLDKPLHWTKPRTIFVCSMTDLFADFVTDEMIDRVFAVMALCPQHRFIVLTKRAKRMREYVVARPDSMEVYRAAMGTHILTGMKGVFGEAHKFPLPNLILGVSVENQRYADERIPELLETPAACRYLSVEPLLGPVDLDSDGADHVHVLSCGDSSHRDNGGQCRGVDWVVVGGESGPGARPFRVEHAWSLVKQCREAHVPVFVKQFGAHPIVSACRQSHWDYGEQFGRKAKFTHNGEDFDTWRWHLKDRKGGDWAEWPLHMRVREFPKMLEAGR